jgi:hypothetical protein
MVDHIKIFGERLKKVLEGIEILKNFGLDEEILISWLQTKTHLSKKDIELVLRRQEEFYNKLLNKNILDNLEDKKG